MANFHRKDSFLRKAGIYDSFLDVNTLPDVPKTASDDIYVIEPQYHQRPDLLAYTLYGSVRLWWVFALRNPDLIEDPIRDFNQGLEISVPSKNAVEQLTR
jgi:hypothetical protein